MFEFTFVKTGLLDAQYYTLPRESDGQTCLLITSF